jgi:hypothetical protein
MEKQIDGDISYFATSSNIRSKPIDYRLRITHDVSTIGKVHLSKRWFRIWDKTEDCWIFIGMQFGREPIENEILRS